MSSKESKCSKMCLNKLISLKEPEWALISLNEPKQAEMGLNEPKWAQILIKILPVMHMNVRHGICYDI